MIQVLTSAAGITVEPQVENRTLGEQVFQLTPAVSTTINANTGGLAGTKYVFKIVTSGASSFNVTFGTGFVSQGVLATGTVTAKTFTVVFVSDGLVLTEESRTTAM